MTYWRSIICKFSKHRIDIESLDHVGEIKCIRCNKVLTIIKDDPTGPMDDPSYTRGCLGKVKFKSFKETQERMEKMKKRPATLHGYHCHHCDQWHLGNSKKRWK